MGRILSLNFWSRAGSVAVIMFHGPDSGGRGGTLVGEQKKKREYVVNANSQNPANSMLNLRNYSNHMRGFWLYGFAPST